MTRLMRLTRLTRLGIVGLTLCGLSACSDEPDFDSRYAKAADEISQRARALDAEDARVRAEMGLSTSADGGQLNEQAPDAPAGLPLSLRLPVADSVARDKASSGE